MTQVTRIRHSDAIKKKAVKQYLKHGCLSIVAKEMDIPYDTLSHWRYRTPWWTELQKRFQEEQDRKLASKIDTLVEKAVNKIEDRIENGDSILDSKTGDIVVIPLKAKDLTTTIKVLSDRQDVLIGRATKDSIAKEQQEDKLAKLAIEFAKFTQMKVIEGEATTLTETPPQDIIDVSDDGDKDA